MKKLLLPLLFISFMAQGQNDKKYDLVWKVSDTLRYETNMDVVQLQDDKDSEEETDSIRSKAKEFFKKWSDSNKNKKYGVKLYPDTKGNIDIAMHIVEQENDSADFFSAFAKMNGNVILRGKISKEGALEGFYYKTDQNNLTAILFELPTHPVAVGESWPLQINLINMDQNFVADSSARRNEVRLEKVIDRNGEKIAVLSYDILEYAAGAFGNPMMKEFLQQGSEDRFYLKMTHTGTAEFSVDRGCWLTYNAVMEMDTNTGFMGAGGSQTNFHLELLE